MPHAKIEVLYENESTFLPGWPSMITSTTRTLFSAGSNAQVIDDRRTRQTAIAPCLIRKANAKLLPHYSSNYIVDGNTRQCKVCIDTMLVHTVIKLPLITALASSHRQNFLRLLQIHLNLF